jgi:serine/threonine-protein kinase
VLAGRRLFYSDDEVATLLQIVNDPIPSLRTVRPELPPGLDEAVSSALTRELDARCPSAAELRTRLMAAFRSAEVEPADLHEVGAFAREAAEVTLTKRRRALLLPSRAESAPLPPDDVSAARATLSIDTPTRRAPARSRTLQLIGVAIVAAGVAGSAAYLARGTPEGALTAPASEAAPLPTPTEREPSEPTQSAPADRKPVASSTAPTALSGAAPSRPAAQSKPAAPPTPSARKPPARLTPSPYDP